jgi:predicted RNA-binding protein with PUA-like domain
MRHWLMKSEPEDFSIDDLARVGREPWSGVRNYQARNYMMKDMRVGDGVLFYHSNTDEPGVAGLAEVVSETYPDPTQFKKKSPYYDAKSKVEEPRWWLVDVGFVRKFDHVVTLAQLKADADKLGDFPLLQRGTRLSVLPVTPAQWRRILSLAEKH